MQPTLWLQALTGLRDNKNAPPNLLSQVLQVIGEVKRKSVLFEFRTFSFWNLFSFFFFEISARKTAISIASAHVFSG